MFKVGDKVRVKNTAPNRARRGVVGVVAPELANMACWVEFPDGFRDAYFFFDLELVEEPPRLYRKGDKITITYEVVEDEPKRGTWAERQVKVDVAGRVSANPLVRGAHVLSLGKLEPAPEPPYEPKPGDEFFLYPRHTHSPYTCLYIDDKIILTRRFDAEEVIGRDASHQYRKA